MSASGAVIVVALHRVAATAAVHVRVDEAGQQHGAAALTRVGGVDQRAGHHGHASVGDLQPATPHAIGRDDITFQQTSHQSRLISATKS
jgi:hypothetical protein